VSALAADGARVAALDRPRARGRLQALAQANERVLPLELAGTDVAAFAGALATVERGLGPVTGAVLLAGGWRGGAPLHEPESQAAWQTMLELNLESARVALHALLPSLVERRRGSVVLVGSRNGARPWEGAGAAAYAVSKAAVVALTEVAAAEVREHGVRVNAVLPSTIDTAANRRAMPNADATRWVSPESLCDVIAFLLSSASRDVSGAALPVYGRA
jgi:NAD(P)-dependent dehydrogenase (short-subunit alcohol dehydrogenase family)